MCGDTEGREHTVAEVFGGCYTVLTFPRLVQSPFFSLSSQNLSPAIELDDSLLCIADPFPRMVIVGRGTCHLNELLVSEDGFIHGVEVFA